MRSPPALRPSLPPGRQQTTRDQGEQEQRPGQEAAGIEAPLQGPRPITHQASSHRRYCTVCIPTRARRRWSRRRYVPDARGSRHGRRRRQQPAIQVAPSCSRRMVARAPHWRRGGTPAVSSIWSTSASRALRGPGTIPCRRQMAEYDVLCGQAPGRQPSAHYRAGRGSAARSYPGCGGGQDRHRAPATDLGIGCHDRFDVQTEAAGSQCQPPAEGLIAVLSQVLWRERGFTIRGDRPLWQARASIASPSLDTGHNSGIRSLIAVLPAVIFDQASCVEPEPTPSAVRPEPLPHGHLGVQERAVARLWLRGKVGCAI